MITQRVHNSQHGAMAGASRRVIAVVMLGLWSCAVAPTAGCTHAWVHYEERFDDTMESRLTVSGGTPTIAVGRPSKHVDDDIRVEGTIRFERKSRPWHIYMRVPTGNRHIGEAKAFVTDPEHKRAELAPRFDRKTNARRTLADVRSGLAPGEHMWSTATRWRELPLTGLRTEVEWNFALTKDGGESPFGAGKSGVDPVSGGFTVTLGDQTCRAAVRSGAPHYFVNIRAKPVTWGNGLHPMRPWVSIEVTSDDLRRALNR